MFFEIVHERQNAVLLRLFECGEIDGIVFNDVYEVSRNLPVYANKFIRIFQTIIEVVKKNIFKGDLTARLLVKIIKCFNQRLDIIGIIDWHDLMTLGVVGSMQ